MSLEAIGVITIVLGFIGLYKGRYFTMTAFILFNIFGSAAAFLLGSSGNVSPAHLMLLFLAIATFDGKQAFITAISTLSFPKPGFWLVCFTVYAVFAAYFMPRIFYGSTYINAVGVTEYGPAVSTVPLSPTSGNLTQTVYQLSDLLCFVIFAVIGTLSRGFKVITRGLILYTILDVIMAIVDMITGATGTGYLLAPIRNAAYTLHVDETVGGMRRISGSFLEASAFSSATIPVFVFNLTLWLRHRSTKISGMLAALTFALFLLSTSSTALAALPVVLLSIFAFCLYKTSSEPSNANTRIFVSSLPLISIVAVFFFAFNATAREFVVSYVDDLIFNKATTASGIERSEWNQSAYNNFVDTYFLGGGLGSIRASSFIMAILSNLGFIGAAFFGLFVLSASIVNLSTNSKDFQKYYNDVRFAALSAAVSSLVAASISGALVDLGLMFYVFAAVSCSNVSQVDYANIISGEK